MLGSSVTCDSERKQTGSSQRVFAFAQSYNPSVISFKEAKLMFRHLALEVRKGMVFILMLLALWFTA